MIAYHGTVVGGLHTLEPFFNPLGDLKYPVIYLSTNKTLSLFYIWNVWNGKYKWMTFGFRDDILVYNESFKNGLFEFYNGVKGYIYTCDDNFEIDENSTKYAVISRKSVKIQDIDCVENAYERILQYENEGQVIINRYENLSGEQKSKDRNMVLTLIKRLDLLKGEHPMSKFVSEKFPEYWNEARRTE